MTTLRVPSGRFFGPLLAIGLGLSACTPPKPPRTQGVPHFRERLYHVYVVSNLDTSMSPPWAAAFHQTLARAFDAEQVSHEIDYIRIASDGNVSFHTLQERDDLSHRIEAFDPEALLLVLGMRGIMDPTDLGEVRRNAVLLVLFTPDDEELVWRLTYAFETEDRGGDVATAIRARMVRDGLLGRPVAPRSAE